MNYCLKGRELLLDLKRSEWLPPYDEEGVRIVSNEIDELCTRLQELFNNSADSDEYKATVTFYHQCLSRNRRYINCYFNHRISKLRELRWTTGSVLPDKLAHDLSAREREYFINYSQLLSDYNESIGLDLTSDIEPPKDLLIEIRVLENCGAIMTENGPVSLDKGSIHFLRRTEVEQFIRDGQVQHVYNEDHC